MLTVAWAAACPRLVLSLMRPLCTSVVPAVVVRIGVLIFLSSDAIAGVSEVAFDVPDATPRRAEGPPHEVEEILVQARKVPERLEDVPISVVALTRADLNRSNVWRFAGIKRLVPNLQILSGRNGQEARIFIRGIGGNPQIYFDPGVSVYVDGVLLPRAQGLNLDVLDIERVEVLRGPQGTLFGMNTVGGAITVANTKPTDRLEGLALVRIGSFSTVQTRAILNLPIEIAGFRDKVFTRFSFLSSNREGYTDNELRGEKWSNRNALAFLGSIRFVPSDTLDITVSGTWNRDQNYGRGGRCVYVGKPPLPFSAVTPPDYQQECERSRPFAFEANVAGLSDTESYGAWANGIWEAGAAGFVDDLVVTLISGWRAQRLRLRDDVDMTGLDLFRTASVGGGFLDGEPDHAQQITQELRASGRLWDDRLDFTTGIFAFWENATTNNTLSVLPGTAADAFHGTTFGRTATDNWSWALFGQGTARLPGGFSFTAGLRYTQEKKGFDRLLIDLFAPEPPLVDAAESAIFDAWTPMASLAYSLPSDALAPIRVETAMGYVSYNRGFKGGGFNGGTFSNTPQALQPFGPEFVDSYEVGAKTVGFDRQLAVNLSLFYADYSDLQVPTFEAATCGDSGCTPDVRVFIRNAAKAYTKGVELEVSAFPIERLSLSGSLGLLDAQFEEFVGESSLTGGPVNRAGQRLPFVPDVQSHVGVQYILVVPGIWQGGATLTPRLDWYHQGSVIHWAPELEAARQPAYNRLDARVDLQFADGKARFGVWVMNLTNKEYFTDVIPVGVQIIGSLVQYYAPPRVIGIEMSYAF